MMDNATVSVYVPILSINAEGTEIRAWGYKQTPVVDPAETFRADVQPSSLTQAQLEQWGISDAAANMKKLFADLSLYLALNTRVKVTTDEDGTAYYDVKVVNPWPSHVEALLVPVQGE
jgi:hypothetical protein